MTDQIVVSEQDNRVVIASTLARIEILERAGATTVLEQPIVVEVADVGAQGPPGPPGPVGPPGPAGARFSLSFTAANPVVVNHGLGVYGHVTVIVGVEEIDADVVYNSLNSLTVTFASPQTGRVEVS